jgi:hypothetical protein
MTRRVFVAALFAVLCLFAPAPGNVYAQTDALPSWNDGAVKSAIVDFVARVTREGGPDYVKPAERIAVFDNDGTLWTEQPVVRSFDDLQSQRRALGESTN